MKKYCEHSNCRPLTKVFKEGLCEYHYKEFLNNGKPGHWNCSWCEDKQADLIYEKKGGIKK